LTTDDARSEAPETPVDESECTAIEYALTLDSSTTATNC
jgi:hypothetical protein